MPVPKGVNPKKYDDCVDQVKEKGSKVNAYAVCASSLKNAKKSEGKKCMNKADKEKLVKSLTDKFEGKEITPEVKEEMKVEIKKALTAGYDVAEAPENVKEVDTGPSLTAPKPVEAQASAPGEVSVSTAPIAEPAKEAPTAPAKEVKFGSDLFKPFTLGATLRPTPSGNVMDNVKPQKMDYVSTEKQTIRNIKMTAEDFKPKK